MADYSEFIFELDLLDLSLVRVQTHGPIIGPGLDWIDSWYQLREAHFLEVY